MVNSILCSIIFHNIVFNIVHSKKSTNCQCSCDVIVLHVIMVNTILCSITPFVSKLIIFYFQNTDSQTPFIITMILKYHVKQNKTTQK